MVLCNVDTDGFATVTLNRPDVFNAFSGACTALHVRHPPGEQHTLINRIFLGDQWSALSGCGAQGRVGRPCTTDARRIINGDHSMHTHPAPHVTRTCLLCLP